MIIAISRSELSDVATSVGACGEPLRRWDSLYEHPLVLIVGERMVIDIASEQTLPSVSDRVWARQNLTSFSAPEMASAFRANGFRFARMVVRAAHAVLSSPPSEGDAPLVRRMRFRRARSWNAIAKLVAVYGTIVLPGGSERIPGLVSRWQTQQSAWWDTSYGLDREWVVPTNVFDVRVSEYTLKHGTEVRISKSPISRADVRAERAAKQATYEAHLETAADQIARGTLLLVESVSHDVRVGVYDACDGQEGGTLRFWDGTGYATVSLPGALRRAGVSVSDGEAPIDALRRHLVGEVERGAARRRGMSARVRRLPANDMARAIGGVS